MGLIDCIGECISLVVFNKRRTGPILNLVETKTESDCFEGGVRYGYKRGLSVKDVDRLRQEVLDYKF